MHLYRGVPRGLRSTTRLRVAAGLRQRYRGRKNDARSDKGFRIGEACSTWPLPVSEMELRYGCGFNRLLLVVSGFYPLQPASSNLWLAAKAGVIGAAFSIALAIRNRTVVLDTDLVDNVTDGTLRL
jgi:hypothetical protein